MNMMQPTILPSQISLSPSPLSVWSFSLSLSLWSLWCATLAYQIEHCEERCRSTKRFGLEIRGNCETICAQEVIPQIDVFEQYSNSQVYTAVRESDKWKTSENFMNEGPKLADKSAYQQSKKPGEGQLLGAASAEGESKDRETELSGDLTVNVGLEITGDGEYVLKIKKSTPTSVIKDEVERAKQMAQSAGMLLVQAEMLRDMGDKLLAQSRASFQSIFRKPAPSNSKSDS